MLLGWPEPAGHGKANLSRHLFSSSSSDLAWPEGGQTCNLVRRRDRANIGDQGWWNCTTANFWVNFPAAYK